MMAFAEAASPGELAVVIFPVFSTSSNWLMDCPWQQANTKHKRRLKANFITISGKVDTISVKNGVNHVFPVHKYREYVIYIASACA